MLVFHGTTKSGLQAFIDGSDCKPLEPWKCSANDGLTYVWPANKICDEHGLPMGDGEDKAEVMHIGIEQALESASVQAVCSQETDLYVIVMSVNSRYLYHDDSCDNMMGIASYIESDELSEACCFYQVYHYKANIWGYPFLVRGLLHNTLFNKYAVNSDLRAAAEALSDCHHFPEELCMFNPEDAHPTDIKIPQLGNPRTS